MAGQATDKKPPVAPRNTNSGSSCRECRSRDSWESDDFVGKVSKFEYLAHKKDVPVVSDQSRWFVRDGIRVSPKVFPPGSSTVSSPASVVLGPRSATPTPPPAPLGHRRTLSAGCDLSRASPSPSLRSQASNCSLEELAARKEELEQKRKQVC